jgi:hypothetical protein
MKALLVLCLLARVAAADDDDEADRDARTHRKLLGLTFGGGTLPIHKTDLRAVGIGIAVEHRLAGTLRIAGGYEYMSLGITDPAGDQDRMLTTGNGHRVELALRHAFASTRVLARNLRMFVDVELGVAMLVGSTTQTGTLIDAQLYGGLRFGYDVIKLRENTRASAVWEPAVFVHAVATAHDEVGYLAGVGLSWGD